MQSIVSSGGESQLSIKLLDAIRTWEIRAISESEMLYHGCRSDDQGIDVPNCRILGNKWFSMNPYYAGEYAWHFSREETESPYRVTLHPLRPIVAVECPLHPNGKDFPWFLTFLAECFPHIPAGYDLSRHFQDVLAAHLEEAFCGEVFAYLSHGGNEVLIPVCERHLKIVEIKLLPATKEEYIAANGLL